MFFLIAAAADVLALAFISVEAISLKVNHNNNFGITNRCMASTCVKNAVFAF